MFNTITRGQIRKTEEAGIAIISTVIVTGNGVVADTFGSTELFRSVVTFENGLELNEQIKAIFRNAIDTVADPYTTFMLNRNIITDGDSKLTIIIKTTDAEYTPSQGFHIVHNSLYQNIKEII